MVEYPDEADEVSIVHSTTGKSDTQLQQVITANDLLRLQETVRGLPVSGPVVEFATRLVRSTRPKDKRAPDFIKEYVFCGAGPRAAQFLILGAKAKAVLHGRANVSCDDIRSLALPVLRHRLFTNFSADSEGITPDDLVKRLLDPKIVPEPSPQDYPAR
jgi:MoxR-like ATPase